MPTFFIDTSILVKLYYQEQDSSIVSLKILSHKPVIHISEISKIEFYSSIHRKYRNKEISDIELKLLIEQFINDIKSKNIILFKISKNVILKAEDLIKVYGKDYNLRTLDILQISTGLVTKSEYFYTADNKLINFIKETKIINLVG